MNYKIEITSTFQLDLAEMDLNLYAYPEKAKRIIEKIDKTLQALVKMPEMYPVYEDFPDFRRIVIEDYLVFYFINEKMGRIEVHRLIYGKRDLRKQLP